PPTGDDWLHEIKLDEYRMLARKVGDAALLLTRGGLDWTDRLPRVAAAVARLPAARLALDGELVRLDAQGRSDFGALQRSLSRVDHRSLLYAFDLLFVGPDDLRDAPLSERKRALRALLTDAPPDALRLVEHFRAPGDAVLREACALGLEGIVSKRVAAPYRGRRSPDWRKVRCLRRATLPVVGFSDPRGGRAGFGALLLASRDDDGLWYAGKVGTGFDQATLASVRVRLDALRRDAPPVHDPPDACDVRWVHPRLRATVRFAGWTDTGRLRHAVFEGWEEEKMARPQGPPVVAGVRLSHPDKVLFPDAEVTKLDVARYLERVAARLLPGLAGRPLSLVRCPDGRGEDCFFQKHPGRGTPDTLGQVVDEDGDAYLVVDDLAGVVSLAQLGTLELHVWGARADRLDRPDQIVFDLDPSPDVGWSQVVELARALRQHLEALGLGAFLRLTGGKGLHVVSPIERRSTWDEVKTFAHDVARGFARRDPTRYTDKLSKQRREGRVFIDYLRNGRGATAIASYSPRARPGAPVAWPIAWSALDPTAEGPAKVALLDVLRDGLPSANPWADFDDARRALTKAMRQEAGD
ncbi:MAG: DNA ligase D, partial [Myxococcales bacterium]|nr:DNA ligase D [Myxococcales bacterium]